MLATTSSIAVVGHVCLDVIPAFPEGSAARAIRIEPGKLYVTGPAACATGGVVSNTGLALHKLGVPVTLVGKIGDDLFGRAIRDILESHSPALAAGMLVAPGEHTSYSVVISPPGVDRSFLHCPGANDAFAPSDVDLERLGDVGILHFGYPPIMKRVFSDGGEALAGLFEQARRRGLVTSLDMTTPDPHSAAGRVDWRAWLRRVLPYVDLYLPSVEETLFMLDRRAFDARGVSSGGDAAAPPCSVGRPDGLRRLAQELLDFGAAVVVLKLGADGLYLKASAREMLASQTTSADGSRLAAAGRLLEWARWRNKEMIAPCFQVDVAGTTGAGDSSIAGLLAAILHGEGPEQALVQAAAVGACSVEAPDATSGIRSLLEVRRRIASGWARRREPAPPTDWSWDGARGVWIGPHSAGSD